MRVSVATRLEPTSVQGSSVRTMRRALGPGHGWEDGFRSWRTPRSRPARGRMTTPTVIGSASLGEVQQGGQTTIMSVIKAELHPRSPCSVGARKRHDQQSGGGDDTEICGRPGSC